MKQVIDKLRFFWRLFRIRAVLDLILIAFKLKRRGKVFIDESWIVYYAFFFNKWNGVMIDVGAHFGCALTPFAGNNWTVYAFEPDEANRARLLDKFGKMRNVEVSGDAVSNKISKEVPFYKSEVSTGISGLSVFDASHKASGVVDTTTLDAFIAGREARQVDFLKIDAEGFDFFVLQGFPWGQQKPSVILCEFEDRKSLPLGYKWTDMASFLEGHGYHLLVSEWYPLARYGDETNSWRRFTEYPCELSDDGCWGNIIACIDRSAFERLIEYSKDIEEKFNRQRAEGGA